MCPKGMLAVPKGLRGFVCSPPAVFNEYLKISGKPIERSIKGELSGDFEKLMLAVGTLARGADVLSLGCAGQWAGCWGPSPHFARFPCSEVHQEHGGVLCREALQGHEGGCLVPAPGELPSPRCARDLRVLGSLLFLIQTRG